MKRNQSPKPRKEGPRLHLPLSIQSGKKGRILFLRMSGFCLKICWDSFLICPPGSFPIIVDCFLNCFSINIFLFSRKREFGLLKDRRYITRPVALLGSSGVTSTPSFWRSRGLSKGCTLAVQKTWLDPELLIPMPETTHCSLLPSLSIFCLLCVTCAARVSVKESNTEGRQSTGWGA